VKEIPFYPSEYDFLSLFQVYPGPEPATIRLGFAFMAADAFFTFPFFVLHVTYSLIF
jgi:hypothetical protein